MDRRSDDHMMAKSRSLLRVLASQIERQEELLEIHAREIIEHPGAKKPAAQHELTRLTLEELRHTRTVLQDKDEQAKAVVVRNRRQN